MGRRLFIWFTFAIFGTAVLASLVGRAIVSTSRLHWERTGLFVFVASQFDRYWDDPEERATLARSLASSVSGSVVVRDVGETCLRLRVRGARIRRSSRSRAAV
jgi:hypothetical protein